MCNARRALAGGFCLERVAGIECRLTCKQLVAGAGGGKQVVGGDRRGAFQHFATGVCRRGCIAVAGQPDVSLRGDEDLFRPHIAVYVAVAMRVLETAAHAFKYLQRLQTQHRPMVARVEDVCE